MKMEEGLEPESFSHRSFSLLPSV